MTRKEWKEFIKGKDEMRPVSISVSLISILYGSFILMYQGYFLGILHPSIIDIPAYALGIPLMLFGLLKLVGVFGNNRHIRRISIIGLAFLWGGLTTINMFYAFGEGYPNPLWLFMFRVVYDCVILAMKGSYD